MLKRKEWSNYQGRFALSPVTDLWAFRVAMIFLNLSSLFMPLLASSISVFSYKKILFFAEQRHVLMKIYVGSMILAVICALRRQTLCCQNFNFWNISFIIKFMAMVHSMLIVGWSCRNSESRRMNDWTNLHLYTTYLDYYLLHCWYYSTWNSILNSNNVTFDNLPLNKLFFYETTTMKNFEKTINLTSMRLSNVSN